MNAQDGGANQYALSPTINPAKVLRWRLKIPAARTSSGARRIGPVHHGCPLQTEQPLLDRQAAAKSGQRAIRADDPMAGNDDRQWIGAIGETDGPAGPGLADAPRELPVGDRLAIWDALQLAPHVQLESRALRGERQIEQASGAVKIFLQLAHDRRERTRVSPPRAALDGAPR